MAVGAVATAEWPEEDLEAAAGEGFATATGVADRLAMAGIPFRTAHEVVARAGELSESPDVETVEAAVAEVLDEDLAELIDPQRIEEVLDPAANVAMRGSRGGPAPDTVAAHLDRAQEQVAVDHSELADRRELLARAEDQLTTEVERYV